MPIWCSRQAGGSARRNTSAAATAIRTCRARRRGDYWTQSADANLLAETVIVQLPF